DIARDETRGQVNLRVREHARVLGPRQPDSGLLPLVELLFARQALELAVELRLGLEYADQRAIFAETFRGARADDRKRLRLRVVVREDALHDVVLHLGEQAIAPRARRSEERRVGKECSARRRERREKWRDE